MCKEKPYFENINTLGSLYMDEIIFEEKYPILFTCKDNSQNLYLCLCYDIREKQKWIISKTSYKIVAGMLLNEITIHDAFISPYGEVFMATWSCKDKEFKSNKVNFEEIDKIDLPTQGEYIDSEKDEFKDIINKLKEAYKK